jgi:hypothetical protein
MRYGDWKLVFVEQRAPGGWAVWQDPLTTLRVPKMFNLRMDPYERADVVSDQYPDWLVKNDYIITGGMLQATAFLETFVEYPPSQRRRASASTRSRPGSTRRSTSPSRSAAWSSRAGYDHEVDECAQVSRAISGSGRRWSRTVTSHGLSSPRCFRGRSRRIASVVAEGG